MRSCSAALVAGAPRGGGGATVRGAGGGGAAAATEERRQVAGRPPACGPLSSVVGGESQEGGYGAGFVAPSVAILARSCRSVVWLRLCIGERGARLCGSARSVLPQRGAGGLKHAHGWYLLIRAAWS